MQCPFVRPIPEQYRAIRTILQNEEIEAVLVDCVFAGVLPPLTDHALPHPPILAAGIMPLAQTNRDVAPYDTALPPSSTPPGADAPAAERVEVTGWLVSPETYSWFVRERGWSGPRYARWLADSIETLVLGGPIAAVGS